MSPTRRPADLCALAIADDAYDDWELWLSEKLTGLAGRALRDELGTQFRAAPFPAADVVGYEQELREIAVHSGGNITETQSRVFGLFGDSEDDKNVGGPPSPSARRSSSHTTATCSTPASAACQCWAGSKGSSCSSPLRTSSTT
jgi:hypothetical protein